MERHPNGFYTFSDSYLKSVKKQYLINYIRTIEKNWENALITNEIQYKNYKKLLAEEHNKTIDEFSERLKERIVGMQMAELQGEDICPCAENGKECPYINQDIGCQYCAREHTIKEIDEIAEEMRGAE